jgi:hypothetical protein
MFTRELAAGTVATKNRVKRIFQIGGTLVWIFAASALGANSSIFF